MRTRHDNTSGKSRLARAALSQWLAERAPKIERVLKASCSGGATFDTSKLKESERAVLWKWIQRHDPGTGALLKSEEFRQLRDDLTRVFRASLEPENREAFCVAVGIPSATVYRVARLEQRRERSITLDQGAKRAEVFCGVHGGSLFVLREAREESVGV